MRIICFGDSNTYGFDPRSYFGSRYSAADRWVDILAHKTGWEILNAGQNGREIPSRPHELALVGELCDAALPPDLFVVMLGHNDLLQGNSVAAVCGRMDAFLMRLPLPQERILLVAPPPMRRGEWVTDDRLAAASVQLGAGYQALAEKHGIGFADAGAWHIDLTFDGVHFTEAGHHAFAEGILTVLKHYLK